MERSIRNGEHMCYKTNDVVLYATHGVCKISAITEMDLRGTCFECYALKPLYYDKCTIFVPVNNKTLTEKMRRLLSAEEICALIKTMPEKTAVWVDDEVVRNRQYKEILESGDRVELIKLIKTLYFQQQSQKSKNKSLN
ncbi:MAG: CarD family transcriptional regulator, partial [Synergistaceae bacterium]|nr:CarD family transcriptional regulator [Synergistaceae bacterium]